VATQYYDNEPFIVEHVFREVKLKVEAKYGTINEARTREMLYVVMKDQGSNSFTTALSRAKTVVRVPEAERSKYHSFGVRYFKHPDVHKSGQKKAPRLSEPAPTNWDMIKYLCSKEVLARAIETHEDIISPNGEDLDWSPDYEGLKWHNET
jgi:hypothetical protein